MARKNEITHTGKILEITPEFTTVEIISSSACAECHVKGMCGMADEEAKIIMVPTDPYSEYAPGEEVEVVLKKSMGLRAVWISYVIPLLILMILILSLSAFGVKEIFTGIGAIAGVALYYICIYIFRDSLARDFVFKIRSLR